VGARGSAEASEIVGTQVADNGGLAARSSLTSLRSIGLGAAGITLGEAPAEPPKGSKVTVTSPARFPRRPTTRRKEAQGDRRRLQRQGPRCGDNGQRRARERLRLGRMRPQGQETKGVKITDYAATAKLDPKKTPCRRTHRRSSPITRKATSRSTTPSSRQWPEPSSWRRMPDSSAWSSRTRRPPMPRTSGSTQRAPRRCRPSARHTTDDRPRPQSEGGPPSSRGQGGAQKAGYCRRGVPVISHDGCVRPLAMSRG
jgi:hypothetical protein